MKVAVTGKGGVGNTTVTGILARALARAGVPVVAVDADPNPNLAITLGMGVEQAARLESIVNVLQREKAAHSHDHDHDHEHDEAPPRSEDAEDLLAEFGFPAPDGVRLVQTGRIERPSEGCLCCGSHRTTRRVFDELVGQDRMVVADLEAGVNDLMWAWPKPEDAALIVTEPYMKSVEVARRAMHVIKQLGVGQVIVVANRVAEPAEAEEVRAMLPDVEVIEIPEDPAVTQAARKGLSPVDTAPDCPAVEAVAALAARLMTPSVTPS